MHSVRIIRVWIAQHLGSFGQYRVNRSFSRAISDDVRLPIVAIDRSDTRGEQFDRLFSSILSISTMSAAIFRVIQTSLNQNRRIRCDFVAENSESIIQASTESTSFISTF
jgi:hypothetical protein